MIPYAIYDGGHGTGAKLLATVMANTAQEAKNLIYSAIGLSKEKCGPDQPLYVNVTLLSWYKNPDNSGIAWAANQPLMNKQNYRYSAKICSEVQDAYNDGQYICPTCVKPMSWKWDKTKKVRYGRHLGQDLIQKLTPLTTKIIDDKEVHGNVYTCETCLLSYSTRTLEKIIESVES